MERETAPPPVLGKEIEGWTNAVGRITSIDGFFCFVMNKVKKILVLALIIAAMLVVWADAKKPVRLRLATTTSTDNSGLLDVLIPAFEKGRNIKVHVIAVGTGRALQLGRSGDVDLLMVHAKEAELKFVSESHGINRVEFMYNTFVFLGPLEDPAKISSALTGVKAIKRIAGSKVKFLSRGDESGTHKKELSLWKKAGINPRGKWYMEMGQGMGALIIAANEMEAYTLSDIATYYAFENKTDLKALCCKADPGMRNVYSVIAVNPERHKGVKYKEASAFIDWIARPETSKLIRKFKVNGRNMFIPLPVK